MASSRSRRLRRLKGGSFSLNGFMMISRCAGRVVERLASVLGGFQYGPLVSSVAVPGDFWYSSTPRAHSRLRSDSTPGGAARIFRLDDRIAMHELADTEHILQLAL